MAETKQIIKSKAVTGPSIIRPCTCRHESQDQLYGSGRRLWNHAPSKGGKPRRYRCTICLHEQEF